MKMKRLTTLLAAMAIAMFAMVHAGVYSPEDIANARVTKLHDYVSNPDGILSPEAVDSINNILTTLRKTTSAEVAVVAIDEMADGYDEDHFATEFFELCGLGKKDKENGLLVLLVGKNKRYVVRTGRGLGGVLPDVVCSRVMRKQAVPLFKQGDYGGGMLAAVKTFSDVLSDPAKADEIRSEYGDKATRNKKGEDGDLFSFVLGCGAVAGVGSLIWVISTIIAGRGKDERERYRRLNDVMPVVMFLSFLSLGMALPALIICRWKMKRLRDHKRQCPNCNHTMRKLDEATDNNYLTPAQDMEERINSVDYDVWLCDNCGEKDVIPYINRQSAYKVCDHCGARTSSLSGNRIIIQPTTTREGRGERIYSCRNCGYRTVKPYSIAKLATPVVIFPGGGGGGLGGGGGFGGGSFGGGFGGGGTSGGGASGGW